MGWTGTPNEYGYTVEELVREEIESGGRHRIVAKSGRYYAVEDTETGYVTAVVALTGRDAEMTYTKLVDETMGPYNVDCPPRILNLLTEPAPNQYAYEWRQACRERALHKAAMPKLQPGDVIRLEEPIRFTNGMAADTFRFVRRYTFEANGYRVRLPKNWKTRYRWEKIDG